MKREILILCMLLVNLFGYAATVKELKVENLREPLGIDTPTPHFSWQIESKQRGCRQKSYRIVVCDASGKEVWNSGMVSGSEQSGIAYAGAQLVSCAAYTWTVRVRTTDGVAESSSVFETGFLDDKEWTGKWIGKAENSSSAADDTRVPYLG
ncbi:MAG: hypothetical protein K2J96_00985, partial [Bacteroidaceae bacterium]|nr:hypothetical protein [Bacteroidaceae bacterium]